MNPSCTVYYQEGTKSYNVCLTGVVATSFHTDKGQRILMQIPESLAQELSLKFDYEKDINAMSQEQADNENAEYDEKQQMERDSMP